MKKINMSLLFLSSILSCSGAEEENKLEEEKGISTSLSDKKFVVIPLAIPKNAPKTSAVQLSAKKRADRIISKEYQNGFGMFATNRDWMFDEDQRLTPSALAALKAKANATLQIRSNSPEPCQTSVPLEIVREEEPE